ncbi:Holliday junction resolvase RecU [Escherichia coli]
MFFKLNRVAFSVDYDGVYKGRAIAFEAKSTENATRFNLKKQITPIFSVFSK